MEQIESGRAVVLRNWLSPEETTALREDQMECLKDEKNFLPFTSNIHRGNILSMPSFSGRGRAVGAFNDPTVGDFVVFSFLFASTSRKFLSRIRSERCL